MEGLVCGWEQGWMDKIGLDRKTGRQIDGVDLWMDGWIGLDKMDEWMDEQTDR